MKELRLLVRVRNNLLRERRFAAGLTVKQLARRTRMSFQAYGRIETMYDRPRMADGSWRKIALRLARYYRCPVEELFPPGIEAVRQPTISRKVDVAEIGPLLEVSGAARKLLPPGVRLRTEVVHKALVEMVDGASGINHAYPVDNTK